MHRRVSVSLSTARVSKLEHEFGGQKNRIMELAVGEILSGKVTGITKFGAFVALPEGKNGMVHISEIAQTYVGDIHEHLQEGQEVRVKIIAVDQNGRINLSIKKAVSDQQTRSGGRPARQAGGADVHRVRPQHASRMLRSRSRISSSILCRTVKAVCRISAIIWTARMAHAAENKRKFQCRLWAAFSMMQVKWIVLGRIKCGKVSRNHRFALGKCIKNCPQTCSAGRIGLWG